MSEVLQAKGKPRGYCAGCGLMRLAYERRCPKCGGAKLAATKPPAAVLVQLKTYGGGYEV